MPKITIYENDNTGAVPAEDLAVVFVPGTAALKAGVADSYNCVYIPSSAPDLTAYFSCEYTEEEDKAAIDVQHMIRCLNEWGYGVIYQYIDPNVSGENILVYSSAEVSSETFKEEKYFKVENGEFVSATTFEEGTDYFTRAEERKAVLPTETEKWKFLKDKNDYNVKFITTGNFGTIEVTASQGTQQAVSNSKRRSTATETVASDNDVTYAFNADVLNALLPIVAERKDCVILTDLAYNDPQAATTIIHVDGNKMATALKTWLQTTDNLEQAGVANGVTTNFASRAAVHMPNAYMSFIGATEEKSVRVPASFAYLYSYAKSNAKNPSWLPMAGVNRGVLEGVFTPDLSFSKYTLDTEIISDEEGISFNGLVNVRPYGYTIWGDRTLLSLTKGRGLQATGYLSLRNLVSDVAHVAYDSAIQFTYETNNDVTWMNFKSNITTLLDQMVASGVLQTYKVKRRAAASNERNKIVAVITLFPVLPVENFDVYVNLENAEVTVEE